MFTVDVKQQYNNNNYIPTTQLVLCCVAAVKRLPVHHHSAGYIFWLFGIIGLILSPFEKSSARGRRQCFTITLLHTNSLSKTESAVFVSLMRSLLPKDLHSELI